MKKFQLSKVLDTCAGRRVLVRQRVGIYRTIIREVFIDEVTLHGRIKMYDLIDRTFEWVGKRRLKNFFLLEILDGRNASPGIQEQMDRTFDEAQKKDAK